MPPPPTLRELFPIFHQEDWPFFDQNANVHFTLRFSAKTRDSGREIELVGFQQANTAFDQMLLTPAGIELNRGLQSGAAFDIQPPLLLTAGPEENRVASLLPVAVDPPSDGRTVSKKFTTWSDPSTGVAVPAWEVVLESHDKRGKVNLHGTMLLALKRGLVSWICQDNGLYTVLRRAAPPATPPAPPAPPDGPMPDEFLHLTAGSVWRFARRSNPADVRQLHAGAAPESRLTWDGPAPILLRRLAYSKGCVVTEVEVFGMRLPLPAEWRIASEHLDWAHPYPFESIVEAPTVPAPAGMARISGLRLRAIWSREPMWEWSASAAGPFADLDVRFLQFEVSGSTVDDRALPTQRQVLALGRRLGPARIVTRSEQDPPVFWDLASQTDQ